jgi:ABC-2 type transport system permease protein
VPLLVVTPLTFLGGVFYSVAALGEPWRTVTHLNPILYLVSGFRWTFFDTADVPLAASVAVMAGAILIPLAAIAWIFRTGYRLKN